MIEGPGPNDWRCSHIVFLCDDHNPCTCNLCIEGVCQNPPPDGGGYCAISSDYPFCNDGNPCTDDFCLNGECAHEPLECYDTDVCDGTSWCDSSLTYGYCQAGTPLNCNDNSLCTIDSCDPLAGCKNEPRSCDDNNVCTDDSCNPATGCVHTNNSAPCDDHNACTVGDYCAGGSCRSGTPRVCPDANNADGDVCNGREECRWDVGCVRVNIPNCENEVPADDPCTDEGCHPVTGCFHGCFEFPDEWHLPDADDHTFVTAARDVVLSLGSSFNINVTRYAGPTNTTDHTLINAAELVERGLAGEFAELEIITFGASDAACDTVYFNGEGVDTLASQSACLQGSGCSWSATTFKIPFQKVKCPDSRAYGPGSPIPQPNTIAIVFSASPPRSCLKVYGAVLRVKLMSPIILIHGNNSNGGFFTRQGLTGSLTSNRLLWDNSINMQTSYIRNNAAQLYTRIPQVAKNFGVDSVHLVAHSKGGLDTRSYLATFYNVYTCDGVALSDIDGNAVLTNTCRTDSDCGVSTRCLRNAPRVLTLITLDTPHNGSVLADVGAARFHFVTTGAVLQFPDYPLFTSTLAGIAGVDKGLYELRTEECANFNADNTNQLPRDVRYRAIAGDADKDYNGRIDSGEYEELLLENRALRDHSFAARSIVDVLYQILRKSPSITIEKQNKEICGSEGCVTVPFVRVLATPYDGLPLQNDTLVTMPSAYGVGSFPVHLAAQGRFPFEGPDAVNHSSVAGPKTSWVIKSLVIESERGYFGDLSVGSR